MAYMTSPTGQAPTMALPVHTDDQILPRIRWVPIGKSNCYLDMEKSQGNPIYKIMMDLLKNTNFFRAFIASSTIPSIYIQQFWDTIQYDKTTGCFRCQLDEQWFVLTKDTLREALQITLVNSNQVFIPPPTAEVLINFVNELGYPKLVRNVSNIRHRFHPRTESPLHLPNEETVLGYLKFSAKGTKREVFGMPIPGSLIIAEIREASYYQEYLAKVAQHRRYLAGETVGVQDPPAPKPTQPARKPKSKPTKAPPRHAVTSTQPTPTSAPVEPQAKKRKQATETSDKPPKAKKSKYGWVSQKRTLKNVEASKAEEVPAMEPQVAAEDTDLQKALEESMKPHMICLESDNEEESEKIVLGADEGGQDKGQAGPDPGAQAEDQTGSDAGAQDERQAGSNPDETSKGQAGPDPSDAGAKVQSIPSPMVQAGSDHEHMDLNVADVSPQTSTEQLEEGFTATVYPKIQENLKLAVEE
nr:histone deacetylase 14 [Tanacetum cinerariifolium]